MELFKSSRLIAVNNILFQTDFDSFRGSYRVLNNSWKSLEIRPATFLGLEKVWEKNLKSFFESYNKCFTSENFFLLVKLYSISPVRLQHIVDKAFCSCIFFKVSIAHLFDNLESGKRNYMYCFGKSLEKSWILDPKICTNPGKREHSYKCHYLTLTHFKYMYPV